MRITILAVGTLGDVQPILGVGLALKDLGHELRVAAFAEFKQLIEGCGLEYHPLQGDVRQVFESDATQRMLNAGSVLAMARFFLRGGYAELFGSAQSGAWQASQGTEALLYNEPILWGYGIAEKLGIPAIRYYGMPVTPTRAFPAPVAAHLPLGRVLYKLSHFLTEQFVWHNFRGQINGFRRATLGLPSLPLKGSYAVQHEHRIPVIYSISPAVLPRPDDWPDYVHITGYWPPIAPQDWQPSTALQDFLQRGPPPVYVGFGSMGNPEAKDTTELVIKALERSGQRGLLAAGWGGLKQVDLPAEIFLLDNAPHDWLFGRVSAVVHHGGAGTTAAGLAAGAATVIVPHFADQFFWGRRVWELGAGPRPIPRRKLTAERLAGAIEKAACDNKVRTRARLLGEKIRAEKGIQRAVEIIGRYLGI